MSNVRHLGWLLIFASFSVCWVGCDQDTAATPPPKVEPKAPPAVEIPVPKIYWSNVKLHDAIRAKNPDYTGNGQFRIEEGNTIAIGLDECNVSDITFLKGMQLQGLYLQACPVEDISVLKGMPLVELALEKTKLKSIAGLAGNTTLQKLYLGDTGITDLSPLKGTPITDLNLVNTPVVDLKPLAGMPIKLLWLTGAPVEDISPLRSCQSMESLTLHKTKVSNLTPLSGTRLQRLHIGETPVSDLSPLAGMSLTRLVYNKERISKGIESVQAMRSLREIGSRYDDEVKDLVHPSQYWSQL